jgi:hypothetical protein
MNHYICKMYDKQRLPQISPSPHHQGYKSTGGEASVSVMPGIVLHTLGAPRKGNVKFEGGRTWSPKGTPQSGSGGILLTTSISGGHIVTFFWTYYNCARNRLSLGPSSLLRHTFLSCTDYDSYTSFC